MADGFATLSAPSMLRTPGGYSATSALCDLIGDGYFVESEYDGRRCQALLTADGWSFAGKTPATSGRIEYLNIPGRCGSVVHALDDMQLPRGTLLDGKLFSDDGWRALLRQMTCSESRFARSGSREPRMVVFDVLDFGGESMVEWPFHERRRLLAEITFTDCCVFMSCSRTGDDGVEHVGRLLSEPSKSVEGVSLRHPSSPYRSGKKGWIMHRRTETCDAVIMDVAEGRGKLKGTAGSLVVGQYFPDGTLRKVASVDGMTVEQRHYAWQNRRRLAGTVISFVSQGRTKASYRLPRICRFVPGADPKACLWPEA